MTSGSGLSSASSRCEGGGPDDLSCSRSGRIPNSLRGKRRSEGRRPSGSSSSSGGRNGGEGTSVSSSRRRRAEIGPYRKICRGRSLSTSSRSRSEGGGPSGLSRNSSRSE